jgi:hypothetical protein
VQLAFIQFGAARRCPLFAYAGGAEDRLSRDYPACGAVLFQQPFPQKIESQTSARQLHPAIMEAMPKSLTQALTTPEKIRRLRLFNDKIEVVRRGRFSALVSRPDHGITINFGSGVPMDIEKRGADEESTLALVTTLRFFVQERDGITLGKIADLYETLPVEERAKTSARGAAIANDEFLDRQCGFGLNEGHYSNREGNAR